MHGVSFRRQHPVGPYVADFCAPSIKLIVELDGGQHAESARDAERTQWLEAQGFQVLRFWNNDVMENVEGVLETIAGVVVTRKTTPP